MRLVVFMFLEFDFDCGFFQTGRCYFESNVFSSIFFRSDNNEHLSVESWSFWCRKDNMTGGIPVVCGNDFSVTFQYFASQQIAGRRYTKSVLVCDIDCDEG